MRSRYIDPSKDSSNDVLLDENFLNRKILLYLVYGAQQVYLKTLYIHVYNVNVSHTRVYIRNLYVYIYVHGIA